MKNFFLGNSPHTSIAGYILAGLQVGNELFIKQETNPWAYFFAIGIAVLGRMAADSKTDKL